MGEASRHATASLLRQRRAVALRNLHVTYTEGVAFTDAGARPIPHAWLTDSASEIVDLSPWVGASYYGVPMPAAVYADASRTA